MRSKIFIFLISIAPILIGTVLNYFDFNIDTGVFLSLSLQLVWGIMFALGGGLVYLAKFKFSEKEIAGKYQKIITKNIQKLCFPLILQTLFFILLSLFYPARLFIKNCLKISDQSYTSLSTLSDSGLMSLILIPSLFSILVGLWCIYLAVYNTQSD